MTTITTQETEESELKDRILELYQAIDPGVTLFNDLTEKDIKLAIRMEMAMMPTEIVITVGETRQKQQFEPYNYHMSMTLDCRDLAGAVRSAYEDAAEGKRLEAYVRAKKVMYKIIATKFDAHERFQRDLIHAQELKDGIIPHK